MSIVYLSMKVQRRERIPRHTWILDAMPGKYNDSQHHSPNSVSNVLATLSALPPKMPSRDWAITELQRKGLSKAIALWACSSIVMGSDGKFEFSYDISVMKQFFHDFCALDMWPFIESFPAKDGRDEYANSQIHFIQAGKNKAWDMFKAADRLDAVINSKGSRSQVHHHLMPHVGHWLHSEDPAGMLDIIDEHTFANGNQQIL